MKKLLLAAALLIPFIANAQSSSPFAYKNEGKYFYYSDVVQVDSSLTASDLYKDAKLFIKKMSLPNIKITTDDATGGVVAADIDEKTTFKTQTGIGSEDLEIKYSMKIEMKKGRYRYTFDSFTLSYVGADHKTNAHLLEELDKDKGGGAFGLGRSKRILTAMNNLILSHVDLMAKNMSKRSDDF